MSLFQRISATITSSVDRAVSKVENHDAIIDASLKDARRAAARSRIRLERVRRDGANLKARHDDLEQAADTWARRARRVAADDEDKALECVRRRRECLSQLTPLRESMKHHDELEARIDQQLKAIEARISEVTEQRNLLRSRQSVADAMNAIHSVEAGASSHLEDTLDRWEINLGETEIIAGAGLPSDPLEADFLAGEDADALRADLAELLGQDAAAHRKPVS